MGKIPLLETLKLTISQDVSDFNFPNLIKNNNALRNLEIEIMDDGRLGGFSLKEDFNGFFPNKMKNLTLIGRGLKILPDNLLQVRINLKTNFISTSVCCHLKKVSTGQKELTKFLTWLHQTLYLVVVKPTYLELLSVFHYDYNNIDIYIQPLNKWILQNPSPSPKTVKKVNSKIKNFPLIFSSGVKKLFLSYVKVIKNKVSGILYKKEINQSLTSKPKINNTVLK